MTRLIGFVRRVLCGLRFRLLLLIALACAPLVILMLHTAGEDRRRALAGWGQRSQKISQIARREEREVIGATRQLLLAISESSSVRARDARRCKRWLDELFTTYPRYANLGVFTTNGEVLASALAMPRDGNRTDMNLYRYVIESRAFTIGEFNVPEPGQKPSIRFGYPV